MVKYLVAAISGAVCTVDIRSYVSTLGSDTPSDGGAACMITIGDAIMSTLNYNYTSSELRHCPLLTLVPTFLPCSHTVCSAHVTGYCLPPVMPSSALRLKEQKTFVVTISTWTKYTEPLCGMPRRPPTHASVHIFYSRIYPLRISHSIIGSSFKSHFSK